MDLILSLLLVCDNSSNHDRAFKNLYFSICSCNCLHNKIVPWRCQPKIANYAFLAYNVKEVTFAILHRCVWGKKAEVCYGSLLDSSVSFLSLLSFLSFVLSFLSLGPGSRRLCEMLIAWSTHH